MEIVEMASEFPQVIPDEHYTHDEESGVYQCKTCSQSFEGRLAMLSIRRHIMVHTGM